MLRLLRSHIDMGRINVSIAVVLAVALFVYLVAAEEADLWNAFMKAVGAGLLTMVAIGTGERFWRNKKVKEAGLDPAGGASVTFEDEIAKAVELVNHSVTEHVGTINRRLYDLERAVFKESEGQEPGARTRSRPVEGEE